MNGIPKAVFFDVGWTLAYPRASLWDIFAGLGGEAGERMASLDAERMVHSLMWANRERSVADFEAGASYTDSDAEFLALFSTMARAIFALASVPGDHDAMALQFMERFWNRDNWVAFPDAVHTIRRLRERGVRVGVLSNAGSDLLGFLEQIGLLDLFDFTVVSAIEGTKKPDRRIYRRALECAGVRPEEAVHVGDMYLEDVLGARRAGVRPLLIDRGTLAMFPNHPESAHHATRNFDIVRDLGEVLAAVGVA